MSRSWIVAVAIVAAWSPAHAQPEASSTDARLAELAAELAQLRAEVAAALGDTVPTQVDHVGGFVWTSEDEAYQLRLGGYLQARFTTESRRGEEPDAGFVLRRARVVLDGTGESDVGFRVMADLANPALLDAYLAWHTGPIEVRVGKDRVPFTRSSLIPEHQLAFAERPAVVDAFGWDRDLGVQLRFHARRVAAILLVGNGGPDAAVEGAPLVALRNQITLTGPVPELAAGDLTRTHGIGVTLGTALVVDPVTAPGAIGPIAITNDLDGDGAPDRVLGLAAAADLTLHQGGIEVALEGMLRLESWGDLPLVNPALAMALGGAEPVHRYLAGAIDVTYLLHGAVMTGVRISAGDVPILSMHGPSTMPAGRRVIETDVMAAVYRHGMRFVGLTYRGLSYSKRYDGMDPKLEHSVVLEVQGLL